MSNITRADFAKKLQKDFGLSGGDSYRLVELVFSEIAESLIRGEPVKISGFGTFKILEKDTKVCRNLQTGGDIVVPPHRVATFKSAPEFRKKIND